MEPDYSTTHTTQTSSNELEIELGFPEKPVTQLEKFKQYQSSSKLKPWSWENFQQSKRRESIKSQPENQWNNAFFFFLTSLSNSVCFSLTLKHWLQTLSFRICHCISLCFQALKKLSVFFKLKLNALPALKMLS